MFKSQTLFVIGAGASSEADLPLGEDLTDQIAKLLSFDITVGQPIKNGDAEIFRLLGKLVNEDQWHSAQLLKSSQSVAEAMQLAQSIDTFLESHSSNREFVLLGKLGIVRAIANAEANSKFKPINRGTRPFNISSLAKTWYYSLARQLFTGVPAEFPHKAFANVSFIVFNYDRCVETFLQRATEVYFRLSKEEARRLISSVRIVHPYGSIGSLVEGQPDFIPFASQNFDLRRVAENIKTFSESTDLGAYTRQLIYDAETVIFLGFGFHEQNLRLLDYSDEIGISEFPKKRVYLTTKGMSESDEQVVSEQIAYAFSSAPIDPDADQWIFTCNGTCLDLFSTYWRSLTA